MVLDISNNFIGNSGSGVMVSKLDNLMYYAMVLMAIVLILLAADKIKQYKELKQQVADFKECMEYNFEEQCMYILEEKE